MAELLCIALLGAPVLVGVLLWLMRPRRRQPLTMIQLKPYTKTRRGQSGSA